MTVHLYKTLTPPLSSRVQRPLNISHHGPVAQLLLLQLVVEAPLLVGEVQLLLLQVDDGLLGPIRGEHRGHGTNHSSPAWTAAAAPGCRPPRPAAGGSTRHAAGSAPSAAMISIKIYSIIFKNIF